MMIMDINKNVKYLNSHLNYKSYSKYEKINLLYIVKASKSIDDLVDNIEWEYSLETLNKYKENKN